MEQANRSQPAPTNRLPLAVLLAACLAEGTISHETAGCARQLFLGAAGLR